MRKVKIYGAGSIGNHLAYACRSMGWDVTICDVDPEALKRTKDSIYPARYGKWDESIRLCLSQDAPRGKWDAVIIGTPPDVHMDLALKVLKKDRPACLLIEKPLCTPALEKAQKLFDAASSSETFVAVGYNHTLGKNTVEAERLLREGGIGNVVAVYGGFQEYWGGIFKAHPWLSGPQDTYLGFYQRGGGASGEHSHAINIWQHFAHVLGKGKITELTAAMDMIEEGRTSYDRFCSISVRTEKGLCGQIIQDVVTEPPKKTMRIQGTEGFVEWHVNYSPAGDAVASWKRGQDVQQKIMEKKRPDDFRWEIEHVDAVLRGQVKDSPISLERGLDTMMVIAAAHISYAKKRAVRIAYENGYSLRSIKPVR